MSVWKYLWLVESAWKMYSLNIIPFTRSKRKRKNNVKKCSQLKRWHWFPNHTVFTYIFYTRFSRRRTSLVSSFGLSFALFVFFFSHWKYFSTILLSSLCRFYPYGNFAYLLGFLICKCKILFLICSLWKASVGLEKYYCFMLSIIYF